MTQYGTWVAYAGADAVLLGIVLLAIGLLFVWLGLKLKRPIGIKRPGKAVTGFLVLIWILSLLTFLVCLITYGLQLYQEHLLQATPTSPITQVTLGSAVVAFAVIAYATRKSGLKLASGSALVGTLAAPMIFELPFDLIVMTRTYPPISPSPYLFRLLFFLPLFLVEISTFSFLTLSPLTKLSRYFPWQGCFSSSRYGRSLVSHTHPIPYQSC